MKYIPKLTDSEIEDNHKIYKGLGIFFIKKYFLNIQLNYQLNQI